MCPAMLKDEDVYFTKENVSLCEYKIHKYVYNLHIVNVPKIKSYNKKTKQLKMVRVGTMNVSDYYGASAENIDNELFDKIRAIIKTLYDHDILYVDITGYNFIEFKNRIWIIDFEHSNFKPLLTDDFVVKFINGLDKWNPRFK